MIEYKTDIRNEIHILLMNGNIDIYSTEKFKYIGEGHWGLTIRDVENDTDIVYFLINIRMLIRYPSQYIHYRRENMQDGETEYYTKKYDHLSINY